MIHWTYELLADGALDIARRYGRMPSAQEMRAHGRNDLALAMSRSGGLRAWASHLGLALKESETRRGQGAETDAAAFLRGEGFTVEPQTTKAPFDLLVDGVRVDVKSGKHGTYHHKNGGEVRGFIFALNKVPATCDLYLLVGVDGENRALWRYFIPASAAQVRTITITPTGKYAKYKDAVGELRALVPEAR